SSGGLSPHYCPSSVLDSAGRAHVEFGLLELERRSFLLSPVPASPARQREIPKSKARGLLRRLLSAQPRFLGRLSLFSSGRPRQNQFRRDNSFVEKHSQLQSDRPLARICRGCFRGPSLPCRREKKISRDSSRSRRYARFRHRRCNRHADSQSHALHW